MKRNFLIVAIMTFIGGVLVAQKPVDCPTLGVDLSKYTFLDHSTTDEDPMFISSYFVSKEGSALKMFVEQRMEGSLIGTTLYHFPLSAFEKMNSDDFARIVGLGEKEFDYGEFRFNFPTEAGATILPHKCDSVNEPYEPSVLTEHEFYIGTIEGYNAFLKLIGK